MKNYRSKFFFFGLFVFLAASCNVSGELYFWTDSAGVKHFSNKVPPSSARNVRTFEEIAPDPAADKNAEQMEIERLQRQLETEKLQNEILRKKAISSAKRDVQMIEERLENYQTLQRKHGTQHYEKTIRKLRVEFNKAKKDLRDIELHGSFV